MLIDDVADYLEDQGVGTVGTNIFVASMPDSPNDIIAVYNTGGVAPDKYLPTASPTFQVMIRDTEYDDAMATVDSVVDALHQKANAELVSGGKYCYYILLTGEPGYIGQDESERYEFSINFRVLHRR